jgi:hypothetical protein
MSLIASDFTASATQNGRRSDRPVPRPTAGLPRPGRVNSRSGYPGHRVRGG